MADQAADTPTVIAFLNPRSGGQAGVSLFSKLQALCTEVFDLKEGGPTPGLKKYRKTKNLRILACGGDGTVGWVLSKIDEVKMKFLPSVVPLPLGTANDMSRVLKWGANFTGGDSELETFVKDVSQGNPIQMDRWRVLCTPLTGPELATWKTHFGAAKAIDGKEEDEDDDENEDQEFEKVTVDDMGVQAELEESDQSSSKDEKESKDKASKESKESKEAKDSKDKESKEKDAKESTEAKSNGHKEPKDKAKAGESSRIVKAKVFEAKADDKATKPASTTEGKSNASGFARSKTKALKDEVEGVEEKVAEPKEMVINNYFSVGVDSQIALDFHEQRQKNPGRFTHHLINKAWYGLLGIKNILTRPLHKTLLLEIDGKPVRVPKRLRALIVSQIPSYASGADLWGPHKESRFKEPRVNDGVFEVIGIKGVAHLSRLKMSVSHGLRLGQGKSVTLINVDDIAAQNDGEPWILPPSKTTLSYHNQSTMLFNTRKGGKYLATLIGPLADDQTSDKAKASQSAAAATSDSVTQTDSKHSKSKKDIKTNLSPRKEEPKKDVETPRKKEEKKEAETPRKKEDKKDEKKEEPKKEVGTPRKKEDQKEEKKAD